jgi:hypothetical protein
MDLLERYVAGLNIKWNSLGIPGTFVVSNQDTVEIRDHYLQQHPTVSGIQISQIFNESLLYHFRQNEWAIENPDLEYPNFDDDVGDENSSPNGLASGGNPYTTSEFMGIFITRVVDAVREFCAKLEADNKKPRFVIGIVEAVESITGEAVDYCISLDVSYD